MSPNGKSALTVGENVTRLVPYRPGKPIEEVKRELGLDQVIKLASNENSLGPSPRALDALREAVTGVFLYPDGACYDLRQALAAHLDVPGDHLVFGNGSDELIQLLGATFLEPGDEVLQSMPSFSRYESAATLNGASCVTLPLKDWRFDLPAMAEHLTDRTRLVFITNPNNPTGTIVTASEVRAFMDRVPERAVVVFDEAYYEFVTQADYPNTVDLVKEGRNVIVLRTFSKVYGLAGLRVGYGISTPGIVQFINQVREPFNVNLLAQAAGIAAIGDTEHVARTRKMNEEGKELFYAAFDEMGLPYAPTEANFVWVDVKRDSCEMFQKLLRKGVIVRTGDIFGADTFLRVTIGTPEENARFLWALKEVW